MTSAKQRIPDFRNKPFLSQVVLILWFEGDVCQSILQMWLWHRHRGRWWCRWLWCGWRSRSQGQRSICRKIAVSTGKKFDFTRVGSLLDTRVALLTLTRVATRLESSRTIYHIYYILQCAKQDKRAAFSIPVKSVSFKSFDLQTPQGMCNCSTRVTAGPAGEDYFHPERCHRIRARPATGRGYRRSICCFGCLIEPMKRVLQSDVLVLGSVVTLVVDEGVFWCELW